MSCCVRSLFLRGGLEKRARNIVLNSLHCRRKLFASLGRDYSTSDSFLKMAEHNRLVWVDLEVRQENATKVDGLDVEKDQILEMACLITDEHLNIVKEGPSIVIHHPREVLDGMGEWCVEQHGKTGLTKAVQESTVSLAQAEETMVRFVQGHTPKGRCPLAGNSIHCDKSFLNKHMQCFMDHLHYRIVDVSTVKELCRRWYPDEFYDAPRKLGSHRASADIRQSIEELKYYRNTIFKK